MPGLRKYTERDLYAWGEKLIELQDWPDEQGDNIIQRMVDYQVRLDAPPAEDKVLCPEMPQWMRLIHRRANQLDREQRKVVAAWYSAELYQGQKPTKRDVAKAINMSFPLFNNLLREGKKKLLFLLNS